MREVIETVFASELSGTWGWNERMCEFSFSLSCMLDISRRGSYLTSFMALVSDQALTSSVSTVLLFVDG